MSDDVKQDLEDTRRVLAETMVEVGRLGLILHELLLVPELNMDDMESSTREVIQRAEKLLGRKS